jgi:uncharacterized protein (TIGR02145 family)
MIGCKKEEQDTPKHIVFSSVTDIEGNTYRTIKIGKQIWMADNLRTTIFQNGDTLPNLVDSLEWNNSVISGYCFQDSSIYGFLYNYYAISDSRKIAPLGWRIPNDSDWQTLIDYLGGNIIAGGKLKEVGFQYWNNPNCGADNSSGFSALPNGLRKPDGEYVLKRKSAYFWSITEWIDNQFTAIELSYDIPSVIQPDVYSNYKSTGYNVRCIKDE